MNNNELNAMIVAVEEKRNNAYRNRNISNSNYQFERGQYMAYCEILSMLNNIKFRNNDNEMINKYY